MLQKWMDDRKRYKGSEGRPVAETETETETEMEMETEMETETETETDNNHGAASRVDM